MDVAAELANVRAQIAEVNAKIAAADARQAEQRSLQRGLRMLGSHYDAEALAEMRTMEPRTSLPSQHDSVGARYWAALGEEVVAHTFWFMRRNRRWPNVDQVVSKLAGDCALSEPLARQVVAHELGRAGTPLVLKVAINDDYRLVVMASTKLYEDLDDLVAHYEDVEEQVIAAERYAAQGDPDPFGVQAARAHWAERNQ